MMDDWNQTTYVMRRGVLPRIVCIAIAISLPLLSAACANHHPQHGQHADLVQAARQRLQHEIRTASGYRQIRAAELLSEPQPDFPIDSSDPAVRVGQYRVRLAAGQTRWAGEILRIALDPAAPGHVHAIEAAAKLKLRLDDAQMATLRTLASDRESFATGYILWLLAENGDANAQAAITDLIAQPQSANRLTASYAARFLPDLPPDRDAALREMAAAGDPLTSAFALLALARHRAVTAAELRDHLRILAPDADEKAIRFHLHALGEVGTFEELALLSAYLKSEDPEIANAAAGSILAIHQRGLLSHTR